MSLVARASRLVAALVLLVVAVCTPAMGFGGAEHYSGRKVYDVLEGDWLFLFGFIAGGACIWAAVRLGRSAISR